MVIKTKANTIYQPNLFNLIIIIMYLQLGGATGHIGDPSGRSTDRVALQKEILNENIIGIKKNLETVFKNHEKHIWEHDKSKLKPIR